MAEARRPAASKKQEATVGTFIGLLAVFLGNAAESRMPGSGEMATAGVFLFGSLLANKLRDLLL